MYGFLINFRGGFIASLVLTAIPLILKFKIKKLLMMFISKEIVFDCSKLAIFAGLLNAIYKAVLCLLRRLFKAADTDQANKFSAPIAGFIAGFALMCENKFRKQYLTVLAMSRLIDTGLNLFQKDVPKKIMLPGERDLEALNRNNVRDFCLWICANMMTNYAVSCHKQILNIDVAKFYIGWAQLTKPDKQLIEVWHRQNAEGVNHW
jgi:hypothetical protein